jgi:hypothetical protein
MAALKKILDAERDAEEENTDDDGEDAESAHSWSPSQFPERVTIIGGGPAPRRRTLTTTVRTPRVPIPGPRPNFPSG